MDLLFLGHIKQTSHFFTKSRHLISYYLQWHSFSQNTSALSPHLSAAVNTLLVFEKNIKKKRPHSSALRLARQLLTAKQHNKKKNTKKKNNNDNGNFPSSFNYFSLLYFLSGFFSETCTHSETTRTHPPPEKYWHTHSLLFSDVNEAKKLLP